MVPQAIKMDLSMLSKIIKIFCDENVKKLVYQMIIDFVTLTINTNNHTWKSNNMPLNKQHSKEEIKGKLKISVDK